MNHCRAERPGRLSANLPRRLAALAMAGGMLGAGPARAVDVDGSYTVLSVGTRPCSRYVEAYAERGWDKLLHSAWVAGYLTAINQHASARANVSASMNAASRDRWLLEFCRQQPQATLAEGASALAAELVVREP